MRNLASVAKQQSFGRAGLMGLAECIASAACGVQKHNDCGEEWLEDKLSDNGEDFLDVLRFIVECSKQHFNPNYRLRGIELVVLLQLWYSVSFIVEFFQVTTRAHMINLNSLVVTQSARK